MRIKIADRTLCSEENTFSFKEKIEIARQLDKLNVDTIELSPIENVKADTLFVRTLASFVKDSVISVASGFSKESLQNAINALSNTKNPRIRIEVPVSTVGMEYTCHKKAPKMIELISEFTKLAKEFINDVEFCAIDATRAEKDVLSEMIKAAITAGATTVTICDSAAEMMPDEFGEFIGCVITETANENISFGVMCDDKNGLSAANAVMAIKRGANTVKTDVSGTGIPLDTVAAILKNCGGKNEMNSGIKHTETHRIINQINWIIGNNKNEKSAVTVSTVDESGINLNSGDERETVDAAVLKLGYDLSEEDSLKVYEEFLRVAEKKNVGAKELDAIVASVALQVPTTYKLVSYVVNNGNIISASAQITLEKQGEEIQGICIGDGPVDAAFLAIEQIIGHHYELDDFQIQSVTEGKEAMGAAVVKLRSGGKLYSGNGISTDIIGAAIRAYLGAVNKIVYEEA